MLEPLQLFILLQTNFTALPCFPVFAKLAVCFTAKDRRTVCTLIGKGTTRQWQPWVFLLKDEFCIFLPVD